MEKDLSFLLKLAQKGDKKAYTQFLTEASCFIRKVLSKWLKNSEIREEIVQETLISLHQNIHTYQETLKAEPWISTIAKYKTIDYLRKNRHQFQELTNDVTNHIDFSYLEQEGVDIWEDLRDLLLLELDKLDSTSKEAILKTKIEGKSTKIAALELGIKENAIRTRISRGIQKLKNSVLGIEQ